MEDAVRDMLLQIIEEEFPDVFLVSIRFYQAKQHVLDIKVDTDAGISMSECAKISRKLGRQMEEEEMINIPFRLEVSSPGIGSPLVLHRQYVKNIGRHLQVTLLDGAVHKGKLIAVEEDHMVLEPILSKSKSKKARQKENPDGPENITVEFSGIKEAKVIVVF
ncbi:ribosome maturation factor RimP [Pontibacter sp. G13]|uniref:ribosome maturation factor RimP n=1 Tax=Pontibacter sp. G13 TaxID=3074898 RepID=UPI002889DAAC|nr:ribosome maturation factor RimP [Pontibacter sp. G13]WNJ16069.1 ribosome maturation factor RimP [Pontibacter sp. G13]